MKRIVLFALIAALCAGALLYAYLNKLEQAKQAPVVYESVVVAASDIPAFTPITAEMVQVRQVPAGTSHPLAARALEEVVGYVTESDLIAGEELLPAKLKQPGQTESGLSYIIPAGMRAVTIAVDQVSGVAGFLQRGDYVDVISYTTTSYQLPGPSPSPMDAAGEGTGEGTGEETQQAAQGTQSTTLVAAQNVCVAAVGTTLSNTAAANGGEIGYGSVTLYLTPEDAMRVIQGARSGALMLVLRGSGDHEANEQAPVVNDSLLEQAK